jgi:PPOX class probable F420-dependent enzyme
MREQRTGRSIGYFASLSDATYAQLTTFRRDGRAVSTPVHVVMAGDQVFFRTWNVSGKAKRLAHTPDVQIAPSTLRGRPLGPPVRAEAHLLDGAASRRAAALLARRHPILHGRLIPWYHRRRGWTTQQYRLDGPAAA